MDLKSKIGLWILLKNEEKRNDTLGCYYQANGIEFKGPPKILSARQASFLVDSLDTIRTVWGYGTQICYCEDYHNRILGLRKANEPLDHLIEALITSE